MTCITSSMVANNPPPSCIFCIRIYLACSSIASNIIPGTWYRTTYSDLTPCACSVGTSLASQSSHCEFASFHYLLVLSCGSLYSPFILALSDISSFFLLRARACAWKTATRASPAPSQVSAGAGE